jgi:CDP-glucose 4,6-dehydratase
LENVVTDVSSNTLATLPVADFWRGKRVLITGHTGFKGAWLALWLQRMGAEVSGLALPAPTQPSLFALLGKKPWMNSQFCDIRNADALRVMVHAARPEVVFHLAAQALVRTSYQQPLDTFATNVMGTANVLDALREAPDVRVAVMVTTDKVYQNREWLYPYREDDALGGRDPYSASKGASELIIASYRASFLESAGIAVASARAGNVIGGGDWSPDRLIPDAVRAWQARRPLVIRHPHASRPWQHVLEPLAGYLTLAHRLWDQPALAGAYNMGPDPHAAASVAAVIKFAAGQNDYCEVNYETGSTLPHEATWLALETAKARAVLGLQPRWPLVESVRRTLSWYRAQQEGGDARILCESDITDYENQRVLLN